jgi:uncharacterized membrane protein
LKSYYRETIWARWYFWIIFVGTILILSSLLVTQSVLGFTTGWTPMLTYTFLILVILITFFTFIILNFARLSINVDSESIRVRYGIARKTIPWNEVTYSEPAKGKLKVYGGVGIRLGVDRSLAFTTSTGTAIRIMKRKGLPFVLSTKNPEKLSEIINEVSKSAHHTESSNS